MFDRPLDPPSTLEEVEEYIEQYRLKHYKDIDREFVDPGLWENPHGEMDFPDENIGTTFVFYYGTCPKCKTESLISTVRGTYADTEYPNFCPKCGAKVKGN